MACKALGISSQGLGTRLMGLTRLSGLIVKGSKLSRVGGLGAVFNNGLL